MLASKKRGVHVDDFSKIKGKEGKLGVELDHILILFMLDSFFCSSLLI